MGYNTSVYLIYGVRIKYDLKNPKDVKMLCRLFKRIAPHILNNGADGIHEILQDIENDPEIGEYYCLNFSSDCGKQDELFISCYYNVHDVSYNPDDCLEIKLPSKRRKNKFKEWCTNNKIVIKPNIYTKLCYL